MWSNLAKDKVAYAVVAGALVFNSSVNAELSEKESLPLTSESNKQNLEINRWLSIDTTSTVDLQDDSQELLGVADIVREVKVQLGLPNKDIAEIFNVTRQTLHTYLKDSEQGHVINQLTRERALVLKNIIEEISPGFKHSPGAMAKNYTVDGVSLLDLMSSNDLNADSICQFSLSLAERMKENSSGGGALSTSSSLSELTQHT